MNYKIYRKGGSAVPLAEADHDDDFAAETWARAWARSHELSEDYRIEREDGNYGALLFCTHAGQQYIMRE